MVVLPWLELATVYEVVVDLLLEAAPLGGDVWIQKGSLAAT